MTTASSVPGSKVKATETDKDTSAPALDTSSAPDASEHALTKVFNPQTVMTPMLAGGLTLATLVVPAITPFLPAATVAYTGWYVAVFAFMATGSLLLGGKGFKVIAMIAIMLIASTAAAALYVTRKPAEEFERQCADLQKQMTLDGKHAANASAIFSAYRCSPRFPEHAKST